MKIKRILKHLVTTRALARKRFSPVSLAAIEAEIKRSEALHTGEIRLVVESALDVESLLKNQSAKARAIELFSQLRIWDTEHNNGMLIYLLLADRAVEVIADRGINAKVDTERWKNICRVMESDFKQGNFKGGVIMGINSLTQVLIHNFPSKSKDSLNELSNKPLML